ncbi:transmembrane protein 192 isoform X2 [Malaclemys terrapin pileata]|uniref:transmembrane protein 192 isoform X2 n=1 Tax=Malaclemys terrapin pileata TaxID=2991368 RepID=UPI0023A90DC8|nr:transmembrane protein 192 isoform X2 [Malaclemys terrapin pileata]
MAVEAAAGPQRDLDNGSLEITQSTEDDPLLDAPLLPPHALHSQLRPRFHAIPTVLVANFLLLIHVAFVVLVFLAGIYCSYVNPNEDECPGNYTNPFKVQSVIIIAKVILWILHVVFERYVQHHHGKVRCRGYLLIYRSTRHLKRLPLLIHSIVKISNFNKARPRPDIIEEEKMYAYPSRITSEIGFRESSSLEEIVEKQGDVIDYLQRHNALLSKRLLALTSQQIRG